MDREFKIAHLIGITRNHEDVFRHAERVLTEQGYIVFCPVFYDLDKYLSFGEYPNMLDRMCYEKLTICDIIVLVTPEHVGTSTSNRIREADALHKPVYILNNNDELEEFDARFRVTG